jgi:hypothetical protein
LPAKGNQLKNNFHNGINSFVGAHQHLFQGFMFSPTLYKELNAVLYICTFDDLLTDWHKGLGPGVVMHRSREVARANKRLHSAIDNYSGTGLSIGKVDDARLDTPVPTPPQTYHEFMNFLQRYYTLLNAWLTKDCNLYQIVHALYTEVLSAVRLFNYHKDWYESHGPYIIWRLVLTAKDFFDQTRTSGTAGPYQGPVLLTSDPRAFAQQLLLHARLTTSILELPPVLQKPFGPAPGFQQALPPPLAGPPTPGTEAMTMQRPDKDKKAKGTGKGNRTGHVHPTPAQSLIQVFASLQKDTEINSRYKKTTAFLQQAGLSVLDTLTTLGLTEQDCLNYHVRGSCYNKACIKTHEVKPIQAHILQNLVGKLTPVVPSLRNKPYSNPPHQS